MQQRTRGSTFAGRDTQTMTAPQQQGQQQPPQGQQPQGQQPQGQQPQGQQPQGQQPQGQQPQGQQPQGQPPRGQQPQGQQPQGQQPQGQQPQGQQPQGQQPQGQQPQGQPPRGQPPRGQQQEQKKQGQNGYHGDNNETEKDVSGIIAKAATPSAIMDFSDLLSRANATEYAMLHGAGGTEYARNSVIRISITNYGKEKENVYVTGNLPVSKIRKLKAVVENLMIQNGLRESMKLPPPKQNNASNKKNTGKQYYAVAVQGASAIDQAMNALANVQNVIAFTQYDVDWVLSQLDQVLKSVSDVRNKKFSKKTFDESVLFSQNNSQAVTAPVSLDYQEPSIMKINPYTKREDGRAKATMIDIARQDKDNKGTYRRSPWFINILTGWAIPREDKAGRLTFSTESMVEKQKASIGISDEEFYRCLCSCVAYIEVWEQYTSNYLFSKRNELRKKEIARKKQAEGQQQNYN